MVFVAHDKLFAVSLTTRVPPEEVALSVVPVRRVSLKASSATVSFDMLQHERPYSLVRRHISINIVLLVDVSSELK